ncbi:MAG: hypothetical protein HY331_13165 [Chloroflexi bacterium]|nr:hypothetical protein [Chloroflexota bacterium]
MATMAGFSGWLFGTAAAALPLISVATAFWLQRHAGTHDSSRYWRWDLLQIPWVKAALKHPCHLFDEARAALRGLGPIVAGTLIFSLVNLWLLSLPMHGRTAM